MVFPETAARGGDARDAEQNFRRILRRKLLERGVAEAEIEARISQLLARGVDLSLDALEGDGAHHSRP
jgi:hypothetical protein